MPNIDYEIHVPLKGGGHLVARGNVCEAKEVRSIAAQLYEKVAAEEADSTASKIPFSAYLPVGSKVVSTGVDDCGEVPPKGTQGVVVGVHDSDAYLPYHVQFAGTTIWVGPQEIEPDAIEVPAEEDAAEEEPVKFQVGDLIVTTESAAPYFRAGDVGVVISKTYYDLYVNFNNQDNPEVFDDGCWYVDLKYAQKVAA